MFGLSSQAVHFVRGLYKMFALIVGCVLNTTSINFLLDSFMYHWQPSSGLVLLFATSCFGGNAFIQTGGRLKAPSFATIQYSALSSNSHCFTDPFLVSLLIVLVLSQSLISLAMHAWSARADFLRSLPDVLHWFLV